MIRLNQISKHYVDGNKVITAIDKISLSLELNEFVVVVGASGSGKSTLLNILSGTDYVTSGEYYFNGIDTDCFDYVDWNNFRCKNIGLIYQDFRLIENYTAEENIELALSLMCSKKDIKKRASEIMQQTGVSEFSQKPVRLLSGGQKQRVAIARALASNAKVLLADEPTANLDPESAKSIVSLLKKLSDGRLIIVVTHNYDLFASSATRKIILSDGNVTCDYRMSEISAPKEIDNKDNSTHKGFSLYGIVKHNKILWTVFFSVLLVLFCCLGFYSFCLNNISEHDEGLVETAFFQNLSPERYIITKNDLSEFCEQDLIDIQSKYKIETVVTEDIALDMVAYLDNPYTHNKIDFYVLPISALKDELRIGRLPTSENEVVVFNNEGYPWYMMESDDILHSLSIGDTETCNIRIVGWGADTKHFRSSIYLSESLFRRFYIEAYAKYSSINIKTDETTFRVSKLIPSKIVPLGTVVINSNNNILGKVDVVLNNRQTTLTLDSMIVGQKKDYPSLIEDYNDVNNCIFINYDQYEDLITDNIYQISVFSKEKIESWGNYNVIYPHAINKNQTDVEAIVQKFLWFAICLFLSTALIFIAYIFLRRVTKDEIKNAQIRFLLGYSLKEVYSFILFRMIFPPVFAFSLVSLLYRIMLSFSKLPQNNQTFVVLANIPLAQYLILCLFICILFIVLLIKYICHRSILK